MERFIKPILGIGVISAVVSSYEAVHQINPSLLEFAPTRIFMCLAVFYFISRCCVKFSNICQRPINFVSKYTFSIYLLHGFAPAIVFPWTYRIWKNENWGLYCIFCSILVFIVSLIMAIIFETILSFFKRLLYNGTWIKMK